MLTDLNFHIFIFSRCTWYPRQLLYYWGKHHVGGLQWQLVPSLSPIRGGVRYASLNQAQRKCLNESVLKTMMRIEESFMELARLGDQKKCLVVFDRGTMDPSAC